MIASSSSSASRVGRIDFPYRLTTGSFVSGSTASSTFSPSAAVPASPCSGPKSFTRFTPASRHATRADRRRRHVAGHHADAPAAQRRRHVRDQPIDAELYLRRHRRDDNRPMRTFLIDTDTASDDAVALIMALRAPDVRVAAITIVAGNVPLRQGVINALYTCELCGADVPVYAGADRPLKRDPAHAQWFHGGDGFGDMNYPPPNRSAESTHAIDAMIETIRANPGIELVTLGPLTNVALALRRDPDIAKHVARC